MHPVPDPLGKSIALMHPVYFMFVLYTAGGRVRRANIRLTLRVRAAVYKDARGITRA
jgi:hypothetical protein